MQEQWTTIKPANSWLNVDLAELWRYRDLIALFVRRDFTATYKQTILGPVWFLLQPLLSTLVFTVVFGNIARIPTDGVPSVLFYLGGIVCWNYFSNCMIGTANTFVGNAHIFGKVYFPRLAVPLSVVVINLATFAIQFALFLCLFSWFALRGASLHPSSLMLVVPLLVLHMALLGLGVGITVSSLTTKYRDLNFVVAFGVQLWMFATPVVYPLSQVPERWQWVLALNPMTAVVETFRAAFLGVGVVSFAFLASSVGMGLVILCAGIVLFSRIERTFMDSV